MRDLFINFIIDTLSTTTDEINSNGELAELIREMLNEDTELLENVRDVRKEKNY